MTSEPSAIDPPATEVAIAKPITIYDLRRQILAQASVLDNIISVANGKMPEAWKLIEGSLNKDGTPEERVLSLGDIIKANYTLLSRILPELKAIEFTDTSNNNTTAEQSREKFFNAIQGRLDALAKETLPGGDTIG